MYAIRSYYEHCVPCRGGVPPLRSDQIAALLAILGSGWRVVDEHHLEKEPGRRYRSAAEFAQDIRRHLADEPILARPPSVV